MKITIDSRRLASLLLLGFASGLPLLLTSKTLQLWMQDAKVDIGAITLFGLVSLPYSLKFIWSPLLDRFTLPFLGLRRGWLFLTQLGLMGAIALLALQNPAQDVHILQFLGINCLIVAFLSATQDIAGDAYRTDILAPQELELGASLWVWGYRGATVVTGYLSLALADYVQWKTVYLLMAILMGLSLLTTLNSPEPQRKQISRSAPLSIQDVVGLLSIALLISGLLWWVISDPCLVSSADCTPFQSRLLYFYWILAGILVTWVLVSFFTPVSSNESEAENNTPQTLKDAVILPFREFLHRFGLAKACTILAFILLYKLGDSLVDNTANLFLREIGFTKTEIGGYGLTGFIALSVGILVGGTIMTAIGTNRALWIFGLLQLLSNFGYYALSLTGKNDKMLLVAINIESFCVGLVAVVTVAYMMSLCNRNFTTTQFALFSSLMAIGRGVLSAPAGELAKEAGWSNFFIISVFAALPGLFLLSLVAPWNPKTPPMPRPGLDGSE